MNKQDRSLVRKWIETLEDIKSDIETMQEEQEERFDNMPEGIQDSEKGEALQEAIDYLGDAAGNLEECIDNLQSIAE